MYLCKKNIKYTSKYKTYCILYSYCLALPQMCACLFFNKMVVDVISLDLTQM